MYGEVRRPLITLSRQFLALLERELDARFGALDVFQAFGDDPERRKGVIGRGGQVFELDRVSHERDPCFGHLAQLVRPRLGDDHVRGEGELRYDDVADTRKQTSHVAASALRAHRARGLEQGQPGERA